MPSTLEIKGIIEDSLPAQFDVLWDSGSGLNEYEKHAIRFNNLVKEPSSGKYLIRITMIEHEGRDERENVVCENIYVDGVAYPIHEQLKLQNVDGFGTNGFKLKSHKPTFQLEIAANENISIELKTDNRSGKARVEVGNLTMEKDLYMPNVEAKSKKFDYWLVGSDNRFAVSVDLPRYDIKSLVIRNSDNNKDIILDSISQKTDDSVRNLPNQKEKLTKVSYSDISSFQKRYISLERLIQQIIFSCIVTWISWALIRLYQGYGSIRKVFSGQRAVFWFFLTGSLLINLVLLLVYWPGILSVDSLKIWRAAVLPEVYLNDHPILNVFLYSFLHNIWRNVAIVPIVQISITSLLTATIFYQIYKSNLSFKILLPFYLYTVFSVPVNLYNLVLWKDIPFAILIVFWAFVGAWLFDKRRLGALKISFEGIFVLSLLLLCLGLIRHNGLVYLFVIPVLFICLGIIRFNRKTWFVFCCIVGLCSLTSILLINKLGSDLGYVFIQGKAYFQSFIGSSPTAVLNKTWENYWGILDINQTKTQWDLWHYYLYDRYNFEFLKHAKWNDVFPYAVFLGGSLSVLEPIAIKLYHLSYREPFVYFAWNPVWALVVYPCCILAFRWVPRSAIFSLVIFAQLFTLTTLLDVMNWRYYYFVCLSSYLILPIMIWDIKRERLESSYEN